MILLLTSTCPKLLAQPDSLPAERVGQPQMPPDFNN